MEQYHACKENKAKQAKKDANKEKKNLEEKENQN